MKGGCDMWIGIECGVEAHELEKWAGEIERIGGGCVGGSGGGNGKDGGGGGGGQTSGGRVGEFLRRCARLIDGTGVGGIGAVRRMREIENRAAAVIERKRLEAMGAAGRIVGEVCGAGDAGSRGGKGDAGGRRVNGKGMPAGGVDVGKVMIGLGLHGFQAGNEAGDKNGGVKKRKGGGGKIGKVKGGERVFDGRPRKYLGGVAVTDRDGQPHVAAEKPDCREMQKRAGITPVARGAGAGVIRTLQADGWYGGSFEGWCGVELRKMGFKMSHVARALGMDVTSAWRHISGWTRYWKREGAVNGRQFPGPQDGWPERLEDAVMVARGGRNKQGAPVVTNGTRDCGTYTD